MDDKRLELHDILCKVINITESDGDRHVYFDPPMSLKIKYPAIIYSRLKISKVYANDKVYNLRRAYNVVIVDKNPDNDYVKKLLELPYSEHDRHYVSDNLHHDAFTIYY